MYNLPRPAVRLAEHQFGCLGRFQLLDWLSDDQIQGHRRRGGLIDLQRGVYRLAGSAVPPEQAPMAAQLRARPGAVVTGPFALAAMGIDGCTTSDPFEILTVPGRRLEGVGFDHRRDPEPGRTVRRAGLRLQNPTAALVDAARHRGALGDRNLKLAFDSARWRGLTDGTRVVERARRMVDDLPDAEVWLRWDADGALASESEGERSVGRLLARITPAPRAQVPVLRYRLDWYWPGYRFGLDYDGTVDHTLATARLRDSRRFADLRDAGVRLVVATHEDVSRPDHFVRWVHALLLARAVELRVETPVLGA